MSRAAESPPTRPALMFDDPAGPHRDRPAGVGGGMHRFVEADRCPDPPLQRCVVPHVVVVQWLLDHHQIEAVEFGEERFVLKGVGAVRVHHERHVGVALPNPPHHLEVPSRLDLDLDPPIAPGQLASDPVEEFLHGVLNADRDPRLGAPPRASEDGGERFALLAGECVPDRHLDGGLRHVVAADAGEGRNHLVGVGVVRGGRNRPEEVADDVLRSADRLGRVARREVGDAFRMPGDPAHPGLEEQELLVGHPREAGLEGVFQAEADFPDGESFDLHGSKRRILLAGGGIQQREDAARGAAGEETSPSPRTGVERFARRFAPPTGGEDASLRKIRGIGRVSVRSNEAACLRPRAVGGAARGPRPLRLYNRLSDSAKKR